ncbi:MAG: MNIO family bufferin maturase [Candidatus Rokuibacteriota bacterium]
MSAGGAGGRARAGIGLRAPHVATILAARPDVPWFEVHAENYMAGGGPALRALHDIRRDYPIALHGVGLSLGGADDLDELHLGRLRALTDRLDPSLLSEHLSWSTAGDVYFNHLLPLPYDEESLDTVVRHVAQAQDALQRRLLIENPSSYLRFAHSTMTEPEFLAELVRRSGCGLLCDVNNAYVTCTNFGEDPVAYLEAIRADAVGEIHLAGHARNEADGAIILIDDHGSRVAAPVWRLFELAVARFGPVPTLVEWDTNIPELSVLLDEAAEADRVLRALGRGDRDAAAA